MEIWALILGYIEVRHFDHEGLRQLQISFVWLCNYSVCISCIAKEFCDRQKPLGLDRNKGSSVGHWCHVNQMSVLDLYIEYCHVM